MTEQREREREMYWNIVTETKGVKQPALTHTCPLVLPGLALLRKIVVFSKS